MITSLLAAGLWLSSGLQADPLPRKPWFGAGLTAVEGGLKVTQVVAGGTADSAKLRVDDIVTSLAGKPTATVGDLTQILGGLKTGSQSSLAFMRAGKEQMAAIQILPKLPDNGDGYETIYDSVVSKGKRIRIFVTRPKTAGKHPAMFLIQGIGYVSNEQPLTSTSGYGRICRAFSDKGYVTVRVEKPGLGDSEGGPADDVDFDTEVDAFRQALLKTKQYDFVDPSKVVIFGHSMGGCEGPILASEIPVAGLAVYGTVVRTWHEYVVDMFRHQPSLGGAVASSLDASERNVIAALHLIFNEGLSLAEIEEKHPKWAGAAKAVIPDGKHFSGVGLPFWRGCFAQNYASFWAKLDTQVLSVYGACDFVAERVDHPMIADIVNRAHPGKARFVEIPESDHAFRRVATPKESMEFWAKGGKEMNPAICDMLVKWANEVTRS